MEGTGRTVGEQEDVGDQEKKKRGTRHWRLFVVGVQELAPCFSA
jgi:hypothetical protein